MVAREDRGGVLRVEIAGHALGGADHGAGGDPLEPERVRRAHDERGEDEAAVGMADRLERLTESTWMGSYVGGLAHTFKASIYARRGHLVEAELELGRVRPLVRSMTVRPAGWTRRRRSRGGPP